MNKFIIIFTILALSLNSYSQDSTITRDLESWYGLGGQLKLADKKLTTGLQQQFRFDNNAGRLSQYFTNLEGNYKIFKRIRLGVGYRFIKDRNGNDGYLTVHRINFDISHSKKIDRLRINTRLRYQRRSNPVYKAYPIKKYRFRLKFNYNIPKWKYDPYFSSEIYYSKENFSYEYVEGFTTDNPVTGIEKYRLQIGTSENISKHTELRIFYMLEHQFSSYNTNFGVLINWNILGISLTFK